MSNTKAKLKPTKRVPTVQELMTVLQRERTDRGLVLVCDAMLDRSLEELVRRTLCPANGDDIAFLFMPSGPLGSHSVRIKLALALGVIGPKMRNDLAVYHELRNYFAHEFQPVSLMAADVRKRLEDLLLPYKYLFPVALSDGPLISANDAFRVHLAISIAIMIHHLCKRARGTKSFAHGSDYEPKTNFDDPVAMEGF